MERKIKIKSNGTGSGTDIFIDDFELSPYISELKLELKVGELNQVEIYCVFPHMEIDFDGTCLDADFKTVIKAVNNEKKESTKT